MYLTVESSLLFFSQSFEQYIMWLGLGVREGGGDRKEGLGTRGACTVLVYSGLLSVKMAMPKHV